MLETLVYAFSDIVMLLGALILLAMNMYGCKSVREYFSTAKVCITAAALCGIIFYNKTYAPQYFGSDSYITMIKSIIYLLSLVWFFLSYKWFAGKEYSGFSFCFTGILLCFALCLLVCAQNIITLCFCCGLVMFLIYCFMRVENVSEKFGKYAVTASVITISAAVGAGYVFYAVNSGEYGQIYTYLQKNGADIKMFFALSGLFLPILYLMMIFPLHFWNDELSKNTILPVGGYVMLIPVFACFSALTELVGRALLPVYDSFRPALFCFGAVSMVFGSLAVGKENNLRRMFAYSSMYHFGTILLILSYMEAFAVLSAFVYLAIYTLAMLGLYASLYAFKNRGEYLETTSDVAGTYQVLPYISSSVLIFVLSLLGTPPLLGFLGCFYIVNQLFMSKDYFIILLVLCPLGFLSLGYLRLIKSIYFEPRKHNLDRVNSVVYVVLFVSIVLVLIALFNTYDVVQSARQIIYDFWEGKI